MQMKTFHNLGTKRSGKINFLKKQRYLEKLNGEHFNQNVRGQEEAEWTESVKYVRGSVMHGHSWLLVALGHLCLLIM